ncbi:hypothetical protein AB0D24_04575 [Streptomyces javensis]|uniref:hypothetical protein n=1 Tax=Streptomyces javensis TaxID=114698 RepID=UPI0033F0C5B5
MDNDTPVEAVADASALTPRSKRRSLTKIGGPWEDDLSLAEAYLEAAELLAEHCLSNRVSDRFPIPVYYNYRHSIELALKANIRFVAQCLNRDVIPTEGPDYKKLQEELGREHSIARLAGRLDELLRDLLPDEKVSAPADALRWLHDLDATGQAFRYSTIKRGRQTGAPARPRPLHVDLEADFSRLYSAADYLIHGIPPYLESYEAIINEIEFDKYRD